MPSRLGWASCDANEDVAFTQILPRLTANPCETVRRHYIDRLGSLPASHSLSMTISEATILRETADGAREDVEKYNEDTIADAKAARTPSSPIMRLRGSDTLERLQKALKDFSIVSHNPQVASGSTEQPCRHTKRRIPVHQSPTSR